MARGALLSHRIPRCQISACGTQPMSLDWILGSDFMQPCLEASNPVVASVLYDSESQRLNAGIKLVAGTASSEPSSLRCTDLRE